MTHLHSEAEFTAPHASCARPDYWHAWDSDSTEVEVTELIASLVRAIQPELVVETGTAFGYTAMAIGRALIRNGHGQLMTMETDVARAHIASDRCVGLPVTVVRQSSLDFVGLEGANGKPIDIGFALFDSLYELRAREFRRYHSMLRPGTIVTFHDTTSGDRGHHRDVRADVELLAGEGLLKWVEIPSPRGLAICEVL